MTSLKALPVKRIYSSVISMLTMGEKGNSHECEVHLQLNAFICVL